MAKLMFSEQAWEDYQYWLEHDKKLLKKINRLLKEIARDPFSGAGKAESLRGRNDVWSRRIDKKHRLVYKAMDETIYIEQCRGHYGDK